MKFVIYIFLKDNWALPWESRDAKVEHEFEAPNLEEAKNYFFEYEKEWLHKHYVVGLGRSHMISMKEIELEHIYKVYYREY